MIRMKNSIDILDSLLKKFDYITALETGTIRSETERHFSTLYIGRKLEDKGKLYSIDNSPEAIGVSKKVCDGLDNIEWILDNSHSAIPNLSKDNTFQFVFLDSLNSDTHIFKEFELVLPFIETGGVIVIDDSGINENGKSINMHEPRQMKGVKIWEFLVENNIKFSVAHCGYMSTNLIIEVTDELKELLPL